MKIRNQFAILSLTYLVAGCVEAQDLDASTSHKITTVEQSSGEFSFSWSSLPGARYRVDFTPDLREWAPIGHGIAIDGDGASFVDADAERLSREAGFYRAVLVEPSLGTALALDFTFPTAALVDELGQVTGMTLDGDALVLLSDRSELIRMSLEGELLDRRMLQHDEALNGLATLSEGQTLIVSQSGEILTYRWENAQLSSRGRLPQGNYQALTYHPPSRSIGGLTANGRLLLLGDDDIQGEFSSNPGLESATFTGLIATSNALFATAIRNEVAWLVKLSLEGELEEAWLIGGNPTALVLREESDQGPAVLVANDDAESTIRQYEPPQPGSGIDVEPLDQLGQFELGDAAPQPSGAFFSADDERLYFVTDFGRVASASAMGNDVQVLFDVPNSVQGTYEAIILVDAEVWLVASDSRNPSHIDVFDRAGTWLREETFPEDQRAQVIEGYALDPVTDSKWWVNADAGEPKVLQRQDAEGEISGFTLPEEFSSLALVGLEVFGDYAMLVTDEREGDEDGRLTGLLVVWEWEDGEELARFAVAVEDETGEASGVPAPSDVAFDPERGLVYITSDTDDGEVFVFDLDLAEVDED